MNELLPIIRRKRRPLVMSKPHKPSEEELNRTDGTDEIAGTQELEEARADARPTTNEKESDADVSTEGEAN
jgi:hypothetical protein